MEGKEAVGDLVRCEGVTKALVASELIKLRNSKSTKFYLYNNIGNL